MAQIYKIVNDINDKIYVGATTQSLYKRFQEHVYDATRRRNNSSNPRVKGTDRLPFYTDIRKYGEEHFTIELIEECEDKCKNDREKYWIKYYDTVNKGYNISYGGGGRTVICDELEEQVIELYKKYNCIADVAKEIPNVSIDTITKILKNNKVELVLAKDVSIVKFSKPILMLNKQNIVLKEFASEMDAMRWLISNNYTKYTTIPSNKRLSSLSCHLGQVCNGVRKTAYGFIWKWKE